MNKQKRQYSHAMTKKQEQHKTGLAEMQAVIHRSVAQHGENKARRIGMRMVRLSDNAVKFIPITEGDES